MGLTSSSIIGDASNSRVKEKVVLLETAETRLAVYGLVDTCY